ncbi:MAG: phosphoribosyltransferase family protein [Bacteroidota bacterium]|nr:phosphoribosyltransferase family protein [Bacteroidota bacterium]
MFQSLLHLFYPNLCVTCNKSLVGAEKHICLGCRLKLPETNFHLEIENKVEKTFWGRIPVERAFAFLYFNKAGLTQQLLHQLKYKGNEELADFLGVIYGERLLKTVENHKIDAIVAVPLHSSKQRKRGYNQSLAFANGLAKTLKLENYSNVIVRKKATETQTKKTRLERWQNVNSIFEVLEPERLKNKHLLLVDDVITTGATLESCAKAIQYQSNCLVSIASIAYAN